MPAVDPVDLGQASVEHEVALVLRVGVQCGRGVPSEQELGEGKTVAGGLAGDADDRQRSEEPERLTDRPRPTTCEGLPRT